MKTEILWAVPLLLLVSTAISQAQPVARQAAPAANPDQRAREISVLQQSAKAFSDAFNRADAKAIAALWTRDGEYIDAAGRRYAGTAAITQEYSRFFREMPGAKIALTIDSLRLVGDNTAIEDGRAVLDAGPGKPAGSSRYTVVHSKVDGRWLMSSVRDFPDDGSAAPASLLLELDWLVGTWTAEESGGRMEVSFRWLADRKFLERKYSVSRGKQIVASGVQIIGWNPQAGRIQSWVFPSDGGQAMGLWAPRPDGWAIETTGMLADGTPTQAVNLISRIDKNAFSWHSVERSAGGVRLPDAEPVLLKRAAEKK